MRYVFGFLCVCALGGHLPLSASAQDTEAGTTSEPNLQEPAPSSEAAPEEPALQLKLDDAGVEVVPSPPRTADGYTLEEMEVRVRRAKIGVGVSAVPIFIGGVLMIGAMGDFSVDFSPPAPEEQKKEERLGRAAAVLAVGGAASMIATGILLGVRKRKLRTFQEVADLGHRRVQWDLARSRLVF
jgi:hypothetical protein